MKYVTVCTTIVFIVSPGSVIRFASSSCDIDISGLLGVQGPMAYGASRVAVSPVAFSPG